MVYRPLQKGQGTSLGGFVNVICSLHDTSRVRILVKKRRRYLSRLWGREVEYRVSLSTEFRPVKLKVDREEYDVFERRGGEFRSEKGYEVFDRRGGELRGDKGRKKSVKEMLTQADVVKKRDGNFEMLY